ncbi:hypothetical protein INT48_007449 [Thamnidium elegans]|uniref:Uncharacterized protein n=1 Tax=Thamnidium elegans TaxID=101142 RepID=A0A8H7SPV3_9FUNG|nr:hypothetical protein INT48_007449 [Thamnidium elegans]
MSSRHCVPSQDAFNPQILDTFCFHWSDMHSYVLVRVLDRTIAILPIRSRLAFLYFHNAPLPIHPTPKELRKAFTMHSSKRIQDMFKNWKHTLVLDEREPETPPSTPKSSINVTLADVISFEQDLNSGWLHAPCTVNDDINIYDNTVILNTKHTSLKLTSRCFSDKMAFMNLVKLKQRMNHVDMDEKANVASDGSDEEEDDEERDQWNLDNITSTCIINQLQRKMDYQLESMQTLTTQVDLAKQNISNYTTRLLELDRSLDILEDSTSAIQFGAMERILDYVNHQLASSITTLSSDKERISNLQEKVSSHNAFLIRTRQRFEHIRLRIKNHAWFPWFYTSMAGI